MEQQLPKKSFFETYQTFFAIIICGMLVGGSIIVGKFIKPVSGSNDTQKAITQESVHADLISTAKKLRLDKNKFAACLDTGANKQKVADAVTLAQKSGVQGTPTFFIIKRTFGANGKVATEKQWPVLGARDLADFEKSLKDGVSPAGQPDIKGDKIVLSDTDHYMGAKDAEIVIVEYSDIDCPFCKRAEPTVEQLLKNHPEYGFVYRHSPIAELHPFATYKAEATECANDLGGNEAFWKFLKIVAK